MSSAAGILYLFFFLSLLFFISLALIHQLPDDAGFARYTTTATTQAYIYRYQMAFGLGGFIFSHDGHFRGIEDLFWASDGISDVVCHIIFGFCYGRSAID